MAIVPSPRVIGLTGPFGSGCSTAAKILQERLRFKSGNLSGLIKKQWEKENPGEKPTRADLQDLGNRMRKKSQNPGVLVEEALKILERQQERFNLIIFDTIRNVGEEQTSYRLSCFSKENLKTPQSPLRHHIF